MRLHPREDHRGVPREERQRSFPRGRRLRWSLRLKTYLDETSEPNLANFAGSGHIPGARLVRCGRSTPFAPSAMPITLSVDHASVLGGRGKRPALQMPHRSIASNSAATTTRLAGLFKWTHRSASHWRTCHQMAPSTPPSWPRWSPPCLRSGQRSESLPDAGCHLDVHMVTNCMSHTMNSSLQILCGRRFAEAQQVLDIVSGSLFHIQGLVAS